MYLQLHFSALIFNFINYSYCLGTIVDKKFINFPNQFIKISNLIICTLVGTNMILIAYLFVSIIQYTWYVKFDAE